MGKTSVNDLTKIKLSRDQIHHLKDQLVKLKIDSNQLDRLNLSKAEMITSNIRLHISELERTLIELGVIPQ